MKLYGGEVTLIDGTLSGACFKLSWNYKKIQQEAKERVHIHRQ